MACLFGKFRSKKSKGFNLAHDIVKEIPSGLESTGSIRVSFKEPCYTLYKFYLLKNDC